MTFDDTTNRLRATTFENGNRVSFLPAHFRLLQRADGYGYTLAKADPPTEKRSEGAAPGPVGPGFRAGGQR